MEYCDKFFAASGSHLKKFTALEDADSASGAINKLKHIHRHFELVDIYEV